MRRSPAEIESSLLRYNPGLTRDALDVVVPAMLLREGYVSDMAAAAGPMTPEWDEASRRIFECDVILSKYGLV